MQGLQLLMHCIPSTGHRGFVDGAQLARECVEHGGLAGAVNTLARQATKHGGGFRDCAEDKAKTGADTWAARVQCGAPGVSAASWQEHGQQRVYLVHLRWVKDAAEEWQFVDGMRRVRAGQSKIAGCREVTN